MTDQRLQPMSDLARLLNEASCAEINVNGEVTLLLPDELKMLAAAANRIEELENFASWVETWVSNPVGAYSVHALDGLFGMTRDKLESLRAMTDTRSSPRSASANSFTDRAIKLVTEAAGHRDDWGQYEYAIIDLARQADACRTGGDAQAAPELDLLTARNAVRDEVGSRLCHLTPHGTRICSRQVSSACLCEDAAKAALSASPSSPVAGEWQPIETAPKDGTKIDLLYPYPRGRTIDCEWRQGEVYGDGGWFWSSPRWEGGLLLDKEQWSTNCYPNMEPTHWMPAMAIPSAEHP